MTSHSQGALGGSGQTGSRRCRQERLSASLGQCGGGACDAGFPCGDQIMGRSGGPREGAGLAGQPGVREHLGLRQWLF